MGKSTAAAILRGRGVPVVDTDDLARQVVEPGQPGLVRVVARFGGGVLDSGGRLSRPELARVVFSDEAARLDLEAILHPLIRERWRAEVAGWRARGIARGVVVIPLLFEVGAEGELDDTICVACSALSQAERLRQRGWPPGQTARRLAAQWPVDKKIARAGRVIWTEGSLELHADQLARVPGLG
jgi:dephospho-CoA kinase